MYGPEGLLIGTLFHIVKDVIIASNHVRYLDLIVDIWIIPDGKLRILDEDELEECKKAGIISIEEEQWIEKQKALIVHSHAEIINSLWNN
jgi:predicted RNA-binding protein associated with RNAse of E/G family